MMMPSEPLDVAWCEAQLHTQLVGRRLLYYPQVTSTNDEALRRADAGEPEGTVVVAETQSAGRGRRGRQWHDAPGQCLLLSVLLRPPADVARLPILSLGVAAAAAELLNSRYSVAAVTKWPNDLLIGGRKVGGVLLEQRGQAVVVGLGLNVNGQPESLQAHVDPPLTTVEAERGEPLSREEVLVGLLAKIEDVYRQFRAGDSAGVVRRYRQFESSLGQGVRVTVGTELVWGTAVAITDLGALVIETPQGRREIEAGEVELVAELD